MVKTVLKGEKMSTDNHLTKFEPDDANTKDEKRRILINRLNGVWQFDEIIKIERLDTDTQKGWEITILFNT